MTLCKPVRSVAFIVAAAAATLLLFYQGAAARPDFDVHPRNIERRIDRPQPTRDTLIVDNEEGDEPLEWTLEVDADEGGWITVTPTEGRVNPGGWMRVFVTQNGRDLEAGHYYADINFSTNDPTRQEYTVPVAGHTTDYPTITTGWPREWGEWWGIDMNNVVGRMEWGSVYSFTLRIRNQGTAELTVDSLLSANGYWTMNPRRFSVNAGGGRDVVFSFNALEVGANSTSITSVSNAWDPRELNFRIVAAVQSVFRRRAAIPDTVIDEDAAELLLCDLDTVFLSSDRGVRFDFPRAVGLAPRAARNGELFVRSQLNWNGRSEVICRAMVGDSTLLDTFIVNVRPVPDPPGSFDLLAPMDGDTIRWDAPDTLFAWQAAVDPDGDAVRYTVILHPEDSPNEYRWENLSDTTAGASRLDSLFILETGGWFNWTVTATDGRAVTEAWSTFRNYVVPLNAPVLPPAAATGWRIVAAHPNPFNRALTLTIAAPHAGLVQASIWDISGRQIWRREFTAQRGDNAIIWEAGGASGGVYILRAEADGWTAQQKAALVR